MRRAAPAIAVLVVLAGSTAPASLLAGGRELRPVLAGVVSGSVHGVVRDEAGTAVHDVNVIALGTVVVSATSDRLGRFVITLPPGEYVLRARRDGYVSRVRETVRISSSTLVERNLTLLREPAVIAAVGSAGSQGVASARPDDHAHTDLAWLLRHMRPMVLRDEGAAPGTAGADRVVDVVPAGSASLFDRVVHGPARAATAFFTETDFNGQVNWVTTGSFDLLGGVPHPDVTGSVAYLSIGAMVGSHGSWSVRGALSPGEPSSWALVGEYAAREQERHAFRAGVSYGALRPGERDAATSSVASAGARSVGSVFGFDRWRVTPDLDVSYGVRLDAHDYLAGPPLVSPEVGVGVRVVGRLRVVAGAARRVVAPGGADLHVPATTGVLLPPDRTFSAFRGAGPLAPERVGSYAVGVEHVSGARGHERTFGVRRFREATSDQAATLFGLGSRGASHYFIASVGDVEIDGWTVDLAGRLAPDVTGSVYYRAGRVSWHQNGLLPVVGRLAAAAVRPDRESLHDLGASIEAGVPGTPTRVLVAYRISTGFHPALESSPRRFGGRFSFEVRHELPYQPLSGGRFDALVGVRNFYWAADTPGAIYDELLTISPPVRFVAGIQVRF